MNKFHHKLWLLVGALLISTVMTFGLPIKQGTLYGLDYLHFWSIKRISDEANAGSIYDRSNHEAMLDVLTALDEPRLQQLLLQNRLIYETGLHPTGTPFLYAFFGTVQTGDFERDLQLFQIATNAIFIFGLCLFVIQLFSIKKLSSQIQLSILIGLLLPLCLPLLIDMRVANLSRLQVGAVCLAFAIWCGLKNRSHESGGLDLRTVAVGLIFGLLVAMKPNTIVAPGMMVAFLAPRGQWKRLGAFCFGLLGGIGIAVFVGAFLMGGHASWSDWRVYLDETLDAPFQISDGNYSLASLLPPAIMKWLSPLLIAITGSCLVLAWKFLPADELPMTRPGQDLPGNPKSQPEVSTIQLGACGLALPLLFAPIAWTHYFALGLPLLVVVAFQWRVLRRRSVAWLASGIILSGLPMVYIPANLGFIIASLFALAVLLLLVESVRQRIAANKLFSSDPQRR